MAEQRKYISIVTDLGTEKIVNAVRNGEKVDIVHFAVGDGDGLPYRPTRDMTALKNEVWRGDIVSYEIMEESPNVIRIKTLLPSDAGGFTVREMGLFDSENQMIAIANTADIVKVRSIDGMQSEIELAMRIAVSNTDAVVFEIDSNLVYASQKDLEKLKKWVEKKIAESTIQRDIVIPVTAWTEEIAEGGGGGVCANVGQKDVTDEMIPIVSIFRECMSIARNCGMSTTAETVNGGVKFYAEEAPEQDIHASLLLLRASGGSGTYINNMASDEEVQEMLNEVFGSETDENVEE
ncbi:MAG: phage tail protein [Firmicutes bacterium]|jgi:hypothetical protein|nr:phage tail protein [Bacillota bacterium]